MDDFEGMVSPERAAELHAAVLDTSHPDHHRLSLRAKQWARWVLKGGTEERALLEELADSLEPHVLPFLLTAGVLEAERRYVQRVLVPARVRWARNRAAKKIERGVVVLSAAELSAWEAR